MRSRILRLLALATAAFLVAFPMVGYGGSEGSGFSFALGPSIEIAAWTLGIGVVVMLFDAARSAWRPRPGPPQPAHASALSRAAVPACVALVAALAVVPLLASGYWTQLLLETLVFVTIATGLNITIGMAGLLVLGHAAFWAVGAYSFALLTIHAQWNFWLAFPAAGIAAAVAGLVVGLPALRLRGDYLAVVTLGFGEVVRSFLKNETALTGGGAGIPSYAVPGDLRAVNGPAWLWQPGAGADVRRECYWFALGLAVVCIVCVARLAKSRYGRALLALREDETAARCMGIPTTFVKLLAFMSSAFWAGLAGVVHPVCFGHISPNVFDFSQSVLILAMVVLGGLGSIAGPVVGAALLWILPAVLRNHLPAIQEYRLLIFGLAMAAMMVVRPQGLIGPSSDRPRPAGAAA